MEDLGFPLGNINQHQDFEESFIFGSGNIFLNTIQDLRKPDSVICLNPITTASNRQMGPVRLDSTNIASSFGGDSQYWCRTLARNDDKRVIPVTTTTTTVTSLESLDCLLSASIMNNHSRASSGNSVAKETDDGIVSQCSSEKRLINVAYDDDDNHPPRSKRSRSDLLVQPTSSTISFRQASESDETDSEAIAQMKEMIYRAAAFRPVSFAEEEVVKRPRRKNVRISSDPQTVAARQRRERISERIRALQKLVPGGNKMDTASMLDEAANYLKFLRWQVKELEQFGQKVEYCTTSDAQSTSQIIQNCISPNVTLGVPFPMQTHFLIPHQQLYPNPPPA